MLVWPVTSYVPILLLLLEPPVRRVLAALKIWR
jgi:hypothetical protein